MAGTSYDPSPINLPLVPEYATQENIDGFNSVERDETSFAGALPAKQGEDEISLLNPIPD